MTDITHPKTTPAPLVARLATLALAAGLVLGALPAFADTSRDELLVLEYMAEKKPDDPDANFDLAMAYARTPMLEKGWDYLQKVKVLDPGYPDKVVSRFEPLAAENPDNVEAHWRLAFAYYAKGRESNDAASTAKARSAFLKILDIDPQYVWAYNYLAYITYEAGDLPGAATLARKAVDVSPDNAVAHFLLGQALLKQNQPFAAAMSLARAMQLRTAAGFGIPGVAGGGGGSTPN